MFYHGFGFGYGGVGMVIMAVFWALVIALILLLAIRLFRRGGHYLPPTSYEARNRPLDIAAERYAKGEISKEEFDQLKKDLS